MFRGLVPFRNSNNIERAFDRMLRDFHDDFGLSALTSDIKVDIRETDKDYVLEADIPGVNKEQIHVDYDNNYLTVSVENVQEVNNEGKNYIRKERKVGRTSRSFYVENIREDQIIAKYDNGVLKVQLPKDENAKTKKNKIEIQ